MRVVEGTAQMSASAHQPVTKLDFSFCSLSFRVEFGEEMMTTVVPFFCSFDFLQEIKGSTAALEAAIAKNHRVLSDRLDKLEK